jgi:hypothetical protein
MNESARTHSDVIGVLQFQGESTVTDEQLCDAIRSKILSMVTGLDLAHHLSLKLAREEGADITVEIKAISKFGRRILCDMHEYGLLSDYVLRKKKVRGKGTG